MTAQNAASAPPRRRDGYHHGRLREAMVEATVALIEEVGPERVTVREAARRAGVSSGAPFRHFPNKTALMTAVAEEAMRWFQATTERALEDAQGDPPLEQLRALGAAFLDWAIRGPTHFKVISDRALIDFEGSPTLRAINAQIQGRMEAILLAARAAGQLRDGDIADLQLGARAMVYGLARMAVDGQLPQWGVDPADAEARLLGALDQYVDGLAKSPHSA
jgi:AcrR family transcriptional regulator